MYKKPFLLLKLLELFFLSIFCVCFYTCTPEVTYPSFPNVDPELQPYFFRFEEEGKKRGILVELEKAKIYGSVEKIYVQSNTILGFCQANTTSSKKIIIDIDFWNRSSNLKKELIVFHELGHCYLNRDHNSEKLSNGTCKSIMRSGYDGCVDYYNDKTRERLIDELFSN